VWFFGIAAALNVVSVVLLVLSVRERRRIEEIRRKVRLERRPHFHVIRADGRW
jgi:hypothetical protein